MLHYTCKEYVLAYPKKDGIDSSTLGSVVLFRVPGDAVQLETANQWITSQRLTPHRSKANSVGVLDNAFRGLESSVVSDEVLLSNIVKARIQ